MRRAVGRPPAGAPPPAVADQALGQIELRFLDREGGREQGMKQFLDEKTYRPGLNPYDRPVDKAS